MIDSETDEAPCLWTPKIKENKSTATTNPASGAAPVYEVFMMRQYMAAELTDTA